MTKKPEPIIEIRGLRNQLGGKWIHTDVNLTINKREIFGIIGGSGSGKTTLLRSILMLLKPTAGSVKVFGQEVTQCSETSANRLRQRWGMLFQHSALFSAMTVLDNIMFPMQELTSLPIDFMQELALIKLKLVGLAEEAAYQYPSQLSGGMQRRAAAARAIAMDPELLFLDEPTSGLDPLSAKQFDHLMVFLRDSLGLTMVIVSHDIESLQRTTDRVAFVAQGKIISVEPIETLMKSSDPLIADYFSKI